MKIVLHCGGLAFNGDTIKEKSLGGSETAAYYMAKELRKHGHQVILFTNIGPEQEGVFDGVEYMSVGPVSQEYPLGYVFDYYATNTPHDVLIIQRHPGAFLRAYASKINLWWLHDLALVNMKDMIVGQLWNIDGILTVSEFHRQQVIDTYGLDPDIVHAIQNGVDLSLFEKPLNYLMNDEGGLTNLTMETQTSSGDGSQIKLLYTSRPERGLEWLVKPDGIMHRLWDLDERFHLYVCGYDNTTPQMRSYYEQMWQACEILPNVTNLGSLTKQELADVMRQCDALVYPTPSSQQPNFEEVSCITAMECMAAGLPFISSDAGALSETCKNSGSLLISLSENGLPNVDGFVGLLCDLFTVEEGRDNPRGDLTGTKRKQLEAAKHFTWDIPAQMVLDIVDGVFKKVQQNPHSVVRHLMDMSDIYALKYYLDKKPEDVGQKGPIMHGIGSSTIDELDECYAFMNEPSWREHYERYYEYEKQKGVEYGPEDVTGTPRFKFVQRLVAALPTGSTVMDYGCAHGHYTVNLAKLFPRLSFIGVDIAQSNIDIAKKWASDAQVKNCRFLQGEIDTLEGCIVGDITEDQVMQDLRGLDIGPVDFVIAAEVIEHLEDYARTVDALCKYLKDDGTFCATTPYGPWEAVGFIKEWPWRAHVHHFEEEDLRDAFGHHEAFSVTTIPYNEKAGSYGWVFKKPTEPSRQIDYDRKLSQLIPRPTMSLCMIAKNAETTILETLATCMPVIDEIIVMVDKSTEDDTYESVHRFLTKNFAHRPWTLDYVEPALKTGFAEARNKSIANATGDWVLWVDADEKFYATPKMLAMLRNNMFKGYGIPQHHFAIQPLGVIKTDHPCRIFRNYRDVKFYGFVHEHPEIVMNEGLGHVFMTPEAQIAHPAYAHEPIRHGRFERNIPLLTRDREENPSRKLGKFLWLRDLAQMNEQAIRQSNGVVSANAKERAQEGVKLWEEILEDGNTRLIVESLPFYSSCVRVLGRDGFHASLDVNIAKDAQRLNGGGTHIEADFLNKEHYMSVLDLVAEERIKPYGSKYYV